MNYTLRVCAITIEYYLILLFVNTHREINLNSQIRRILFLELDKSYKMIMNFFPQQIFPSSQQKKYVDYLSNIILILRKLYRVVNISAHLMQTYRSDATISK